VAFRLGGVTSKGRDRLRELLDAVLAGDVLAGEALGRTGAGHDGPGRSGADVGGAGRHSLDEMAGRAYSSPFHFSRRLSRDTGEPPVAMRRRILLERAAWQLAQGMSVTDAAWAAGYESVEGFGRAFTAAFGRAPSVPGESRWLPAPNGIHFHPPTSLWVRAAEQPMSPLTEQLVHHDLDDTRALLQTAEGLPRGELHAVRQPGLIVLPWDGPEESIAMVLEHQVYTKEIWLASVEGLDTPPSDAHPEPATLLERHDAVAPRWLAMVRDLDRRGGWDDVLIDALCDPPESFVMSSVVAHVVTYAAHRRQIARWMLAAAGVEVDQGDPIMWLRARRAATTAPASGDTDDDMTTMTEDGT
jgi:AraC family transcriptional regulator